MSAPSPAGQDKPWIGQRVYNFLFRFLGPAELGSFDQPATKAGDTSYTCPVCGHPMSEHTFQESRERKRMICPGPPLAPHA